MRFKDSGGKWRKARGTDNRSAKVTDQAGEGDEGMTLRWHGLPAHASGRDRRVPGLARILKG
jgi:hypothetical protein